MRRYFYLNIEGSEGSVRKVITATYNPDMTDDWMVFHGEIALVKEVL